MQKGGGIVTAADLAGYQVKWRTPPVSPIAATDRHHAPPVVGRTHGRDDRAATERFDLRALGWHSADSVHLQAEAMRRAFAVRNEQFGDPDFVTVDSNASCRRSSLRPWQASIAPTMPRRRVTSLDRRRRVEPATHFSIADAVGNAVAVTTTLNPVRSRGHRDGWVGSLLNNEMDDFAAQPGTANQFGLVQGDANAVAPGKRMLVDDAGDRLWRDGRVRP